MATRTWCSILALVISGTCGCASRVSSVGDYDPFEGDMPAFMANAHVEQLDGHLLDVGAQRALFEHARANSEDPRAWLLLARDSIARGWPGLAVRQYAEALEADPRVSAVPEVLDYLTFVASHYQSVEKREATGLLDTYFSSADDAS